MPDQPGIARHQPLAEVPPPRQPAPRVPTLRGLDPAGQRALEEHLRELTRYLLDVDRERFQALQIQLDRIQIVLTGRMNEMLMSGTLAERPAAALQDRLYFATDQAVGSRLSYDNGSAWVAT